MEAGRRYEAPGSETKEFIAHRSSRVRVAAFSCIVPEAPNVIKQNNQGQMIPAHTVGCITRERPPT